MEGSKELTDEVVMKLSAPGVILSATFNRAYSSGLDIKKTILGKCLEELQTMGAVPSRKAPTPKKGVPSPLKGNPSPRPTTTPPPIPPTAAPAPAQHEPKTVEVNLPEVPQAGGQPLRPNLHVMPTTTQPIPNIPGLDEATKEMAGAFVHELAVRQRTANPAKVTEVIRAELNKTAPGELYDFDATTKEVSFKPAADAWATGLSDRIEKECVK